MKLFFHPLKPLIISVLLCVGGLTSFSQAVHADPVEEAKSFYALGLTQYEDGLFDDAIVSFLEADKLAPAALMDYNIALCYESLGQNDKAIKHYEQFLTRSNDKALKAEVKTILEGLKQTKATGNENEPSKSGGSSAPNEEIDTDGLQTAPRPIPPDGAPREDSTNLDRARSIDVSSIRDQRRYLNRSSNSGAVINGGAVQAPTANGAVVSGGASGQVEPGQIGSAPRDGQNAIVDGSGGVVRTESAERKNDLNYKVPPQSQNKNFNGVQDNKKPKAKPIYKSVLFWVVVGVAAFVVIDILDSDSGNGNRNAPRVDVSGDDVPLNLRNRRPVPRMAPGGATLFSF